MEILYCEATSVIVEGVWGAPSPQSSGRFMLKAYNALHFFLIEWKNVAKM